MGWVLSKLKASSIRTIKDLYVMFYKYIRVNLPYLCEVFDLNYVICVELEETV